MIMLDQEVRMAKSEVTFRLSYLERERYLQLLAGKLL